MRERGEFLCVTATRVVCFVPAWECTAVTLFLLKSKTPRVCALEAATSTILKKDSFTRLLVGTPQQHRGAVYVIILLLTGDCAPLPNKRQRCFLLAFAAPAIACALTFCSHVFSLISNAQRATRSPQSRNL